ncbi:hypothetical protein B0H14DRAFT_2839204 [Mycena olivaceomarginata]|nr:hypothetical protein B0H14DRAFT_2839204 [Mycena olivaceomarginata]
MGDSYGWLYSRTRVKTFSDMDPCDDIDQWADWIPDLSVHSEVHTFGLFSFSTYIWKPDLRPLCDRYALRRSVLRPVTNICVQDIEVPGRTQLLHLSAVHDVPATSLHDCSLVLEPHLCGHRARTGSVLRFDTRLNAKGSALPRSSVVFQLVVGYMDGRLGTYDLRFPRPIAQYAVTYAGNPFSLSWNGRLASSVTDTRAPRSIPPSASSSRPAQTTAFFGAPQVVDADDGPGKVLWASGGSEVWRWRLGV